MFNELCYFIHVLEYAKNSYKRKEIIYKTPLILEYVPHSFAIIIHYNPYTLKHLYYYGPMNGPKIDIRKKYM